jgi:DNA polymerase I
MEMEVDKFYRYAVLSSRKKNYLGIYEDGSVDVKGLTGKKRHIPHLIKKYFDEMEILLSQVKSPDDFEATKKDVEKIIRECYNIIKRREWGNLNDLAFEVVLGKIPKAYTKTTPQHVKAAVQLKEKGIEINAGDLIRFVKVAREPHVKPVELALDREIDTDKYVAYLQSTFDQILDALGLEFDKIIGLTKLEQFM